MQRYCAGSALKESQLTESCVRNILRPQAVFDAHPEPLLFKCVTSILIPLCVLRWFIINTNKHTQGIGVYPNANAFLTKYTICPETDRDSAAAIALTCSYKSRGNRKVTNFDKSLSIHHAPNQTPIPWIHAIGKNSAPATRNPQDSSARHTTICVSQLPPRIATNANPRTLSIRTAYRHQSQALLV